MGHVDDELGSPFSSTLMMKISKRVYRFICSDAQCASASIVCQVMWRDIMRRRVTSVDTELNVSASTAAVFAAQSVKHYK